MYSPFAHLSFWYTALGAPPDRAPAAYPFAPAGSDETDARSMALQLREAPEVQQRPLLRVLTGKASLLPWSALHPSWLEDVIASCGPQWRVWALEGLPSELRARLQLDRHEAASPALLAGDPPRWWLSWFAAHVKRTLGYPDTTPWERSAGPEAVPGCLWEKDERELTRLLAIHGTRGFVSAARRLPREEAQKWLWSLPAQCQTVAQETVQKKLWTDDPFWPEIVGQLAPEFPEVEARLFRIALADWLRAGLAQGQELSLRRLAFRLPRRWGEWMLHQIDTRPAWIERPVQPSVAAWRAALAAIMEPAGATS
jgi:hypothetical protein